MTMYSTLMPCHMCAGAIVQFGITRVVAGESSNFQERNGLQTLMRHGIDVIDLDMDDARQLLARYIETNPEQWNEDIGR
jgi:creatinine deaminase